MAPFRSLFTWKSFRIALILTPIALVTLLVLYSSSSAPSRILFAFGFGQRSYFLHPLQRKNANVVSLVFGQAGTCNWDGRFLYVDGICGACGKPYAEKGSFVVMKLPTGLAYAKSEASTHNHLNRPVLIPPLLLLLAGATCSIFLAIWQNLFGLDCGYFKRSANHCRSCCYDLIGNISCLCPECGEPIPSEQIAQIERIRRASEAQQV